MDASVAAASLLMPVCIPSMGAQGVIDVSSVVSPASSLDHESNRAPPWRMQLSGSQVDPQAVMHV